MDMVDQIRKMLEGKASTLAEIVVSDVSRNFKRLIYKFDDDHKAACTCDGKMFIPYEHPTEPNSFFVGMKDGSVIAVSVKTMTVQEMNQWVEDMNLPKLPEEERNK